MGKDKSRLLIDGQTFIHRIADTLKELVEEITIVGHSGSDPQFKTAEDSFPKLGALGGLHASLFACKSEWALVIACDLPLITRELLQHLDSLKSTYDAVVPRQKDGRLQPLCAFYRVDPCLPTTESLIRAGKRRPLDLIESVHARIVPFDELSHLSDSKRFFVNINTPEDYYELTKGAAVDL